MITKTIKSNKVREITIITIETNKMNYIVEQQNIENCEPIQTVVIGNILNIGDNQYIVQEDIENPGRYFLTNNGETIVLSVQYAFNGKATISLNGYMYDVATLNEKEFLHSKMLRERASANQTTVKVVAPMPGLIKEVSIKQGASVRKGDALYILEAMKMENIIKSPINGVVTTLNVTTNLAVEKGTILCIIEPQVG